MFMKLLMIAWVEQVTSLDPIHWCYILALGINIMPANALAPKVAKASASMVLIV